MNDERETPDPKVERSKDARPTRSARARVMDLLARRNYSELELKQKLKADHPAEEIEAAIEFARESKWLLPDDELSERVAATLSRKRKGHRFINRYLREKGLPPIVKNAAEEFAKARALIEGKLARAAGGDSPDRNKIHRMLANRGYDDETIRRVLDSLRASN